MTETSSKFKQRWLINRLGIAALLLGLASAGEVYLTGENRDARHSADRPIVGSDSRDDTLSFGDSKASSRSTEVYFGKVGVLISTWLHRWEGLESFQRLALVIGMVSGVVALVCFLVAHRLQ
jgi:hypothetical protein